MISGATNPIYSFNFTTADEGEYYCAVTNSQVPNLTLFRESITVGMVANSADSLALVALYNSTNGQVWNNKWDLTQPVVSWDGITLTEGRVTDVRLINNGLDGRLPDELGNLSELKLLYIGSNPKLVGEIPASLGNLSKIEQIQIFRNSITGTIPNTLFGLTSLTDFGVGGNRLSGTIPSSIWSMTNLKLLYLWGNDFSGSLSEDIGNLTNLERFQVSSNPNLSGAIPSSIGNLTEIINLQLWGCSFSGQLPSSIGNLTKMDWLDASGNQLTGAVPTSYTNFANIRYLSLQNNQLNELPDFSSLTEVLRFRFEDNQFNFDDLAKNVGVSRFSSFYSPQAKLNETEVRFEEMGTTIQLEVTTKNHPDNTYQWYRNGFAISGSHQQNT